jgi:hypothetical protein
MKEDAVQNYRVTMGRSQYGHPEPRIEVLFARDTNFRKLHAALHLLAAAVELATPDAEGWIAQMVAASADDAGWVYLELLNATDDEAQRGLSVLQSVSRAHYSGVLG